MKDLQNIIIICLSVVITTSLLWLYTPLLNVGNTLKPDRICVYLKNYEGTNPCTIAWLTE